MKNANLIFVLTATASVCLPGMTTGYELSTHAGMTSVTYDKSILSVRSTYDRLGLTTRSQKSLGEVYFDLADALPQPIAVRPRTGSQYELDNLPGKFTFPDKEEFGVRAWIMRGAIREDDTSATLSVLKTGSPRDDPDGNINRFCNHFFDPVNVRALSTFCFNSTLDMSPNWAIGTTDPFATPVNRASFYRNHFTIFSAREAMWRALTLKDQFGSSSIASGTSASALEAERLAYWATVFRALGDVAHLIQDMAQPQHTRNEGHPFGRAGIYEAYADARVGGPSAKQVTTFDVDGLTLSSVARTLRPLDFELRDQNGALVPYPIPRFNSYTDYWTTARGAAPRPQSITAGRGLADYSSRGFLTLGTSLNGATFSEFSSPPRLASDPSYTATPAVELCDTPGGSNIKAKYLLRDVVDLMAPSTTQSVKQQSRSAWSNTIGTTYYTVNHCVMDDHLRILIPRAVAYSAGLIDYFFRGQLTVKPTPQGVFAVIDQLPPLSGSSGFTRIKAQLHNDTPDIATPNGPAVQAMTSGILVAVAKFYRDNCFTPAADGVYLLPPPGASVCRSATEEILVSTPLSVPNDVAIPSGADPAVTVTFNFDPANPIPVNATDLSLQFVYRGTLGAETDAVVVQTVDVAEPTLINSSNDLDYAWDANNTRYQVAVKDQQTLPAVYFLFASDTAPQFPLTGFSVSAPVAPGKYAAVWTLVDLAAPPSYGTAICAQCAYGLFNVIPRRVETATDGSGTKLVSPPPYQQRGTWQNNGTTFAPAMPSAICPIGTIIADCLSRNLPAYNPLAPSARVAIDF